MFDSYTYKFGDVTYDLGKRTYVMGVLNVTPDSFSDGGKYMDPEAAVSHALQMEKDGADFIDVGGMSTRPGAAEVSEKEELARVLPVLKKLSASVKIPISVDTYRSSVAEEALKNGASIINDISGFNFDPEMPKVISKYKASVILMHIKGTPADMQKNPHYDDLIAEVLLYLEKSVWKANIEGIEQLIVDPGFGFGKTLEHNLMLIKNLHEIKKLDCPVMVGVSRKSLINKIYESNPDDRLEGTITLNTIAAINGTNILRVHDVLPAARMAKVIDAYKNIKSE